MLELKLDLILERKKNLLDIKIKMKIGELKIVLNLPEWK
jgi:hypothetical protein